MHKIRTERRIRHSKKNKLANQITDMYRHHVPIPEICEKCQISRTTAKRIIQERKMKEMTHPATTAVVHQRPIDVTVACPFCERETTMSYDDFCVLHGNPPDWYDETIKCPACGKTFTITGQDWD